MHSPYNVFTYNFFPWLDHKSTKGDSVKPLKILVKKLSAMQIADYLHFFRLPPTRKQIRIVWFDLFWKLHAGLFL